MNEKVLTLDNLKQQRAEQALAEINAICQKYNVTLRAYAVIPATNIEVMANDVKPEDTEADSENKSETAGN